MTKPGLKNFIVYGFLLFSFLGFLDASFLTVEHYREVVPPCTITHGCEQVTTSEYSKIAGIPVSLFGALYYLSIFLSIVLYLDIKKESLLKAASYFTVTGLLFSLWFTFLQAFIIKAWCQYCLLSAFTSTVLFVIGMVYLKERTGVFLSSAK